MKTKVFGLGLNKTGTSTLGACYKEFGYSQCGYSFEILQEYIQNGFSNKIQRIIAENDAFQDIPWCIMWKDLIRHYPDAYFILTTRPDALIWFDSQVNHYKRTPAAFEANKMVYGHSDPEAHKEIYLSSYINHNTEIKTFFDSHEHYKLATFCWEFGDSWDEICSFLKVEVPEKSFPHANSSKFLPEFVHFWKGEYRHFFIAAFRSILRNPVKPISYYKDLVYLILKRVNGKSKS